MRIYLLKLDLVRCNRRSGLVEDEKSGAGCTIVNGSDEDLLVTFVALRWWSVTWTALPSGSHDRHVPF